ncbi:hypothetical protein YC2023_052324 [Brassica napus]
MMVTPEAREGRKPATVLKTVKRLKWPLKIQWKRRKRALKLSTGETIGDIPVHCLYNNTMSDILLQETRERMRGQVNISPHHISLHTRKIIPIKFQREKVDLPLDSAYGRRVSERSVAGALCSSGFGVVKSACQIKFRFRVMEAYTAPSPPALVFGRWELLQLRRRRILTPGVKAFIVLRRRL